MNITGWLFPHPQTSGLACLYPPWQGLGYCAKHAYAIFRSTFP